MNYWMVKTEPSSYSWEDFQAKGEDIWDGVRNYQARNFLKEMHLGDPVLFYHSGKDKAVVGIAEVSEEAFSDPKDADWVAVKLKVKKHVCWNSVLKNIKLSMSWNRSVIISPCHLLIRRQQMMCCGMLQRT